jgi:hypothetical protein
MVGGIYRRWKASTVVNPGKDQIVNWEACVLMAPQYLGKPIRNKEGVQLQTQPAWAWDSESSDERCHKIVSGCLW